MKDPDVFKCFKTVGNTSSDMKEELEWKDGGILQGVDRVCR